MYTDHLHKNTDDYIILTMHQTIGLLSDYYRVTYWANGLLGYRANGLTD